MHDVVGSTYWGFGLLAWILERSGRDARGTGGGFPVLGVEPMFAELGISLTAFAALSSGLFMPYDKADLAGMGGGCSGGSFRANPKDSFLAGVLGGSDGIFCVDGTSTVTTLGVDLLALKGILCFPLSELGRLGGRGGRVEGSKTGAIIRPASIDGVLDAEVLAVPFDRPETEDMFETVDAIDSVESRLPRCPEGRLGGNDGDGFDEAV